MGITIGALPRDLRQALRLLLARPGLTLVRVFTLGLVMAATGAVLLVANALLVRPLPFRNPDRLIRLYIQPPGTTAFREANPLHPATFLRFRAQANLLEHVEGIWARERAIADRGEPESIPAAAVSAGLFAMLGETPVVGRAFTEAEAREGRALVILSHGLWQRRYGGERSAIGTTVLIDREPHEIIGVMGPDFEPGFVESELWTPLPIREGNLILPGATFVQTIARARADASIPQITAQLESLITPLREQPVPNLRGWSPRARDLRDAQFGRLSGAVYLLLIAVGVLAIMATANLTNLTLADVLARRAELATRVALGAGRFALLVPELLQAAAIATAGSVAGLLLSRWLLPALVALDPASGLENVPLVLDARVVITGLVAGVAVTTTAATLAVLRIVRQDVASSLRESSRGAAGGRGQERLRSWLVGTQAALAMVLATCGLLVAGAFDRTSRLQPGFNPQGVLTAQLRLSETAYGVEEKRVQFVSTVLDRVRAVPGVIDASTTMNLFIPGFTYQTLVQIEGQPSPDGQLHTVLFRRINPGYFKTLQIRELSGRTFDVRDVKSSLLVAVVSQSFARRFWPDGDAVGRRFQRGNAQAPWTTIIGVVDDVYDIGFGQEPGAIVYVPYAQNSNALTPVSLVVRTAGDPMSFEPQIKAAVREVDPAQPIGGVATLESFLADSLGPQRFRSVLLISASAIGCLLVIMGLYAVTTRSVVERTREAGVRLALGGTPRHVWWTIAARSLMPFAAGVGSGVAGALVAVPALATLLPDMTNASYLWALPGLFAVSAAGTLAAMWAARRVVRVEPAVALSRASQ